MRAYSFDSDTGYALYIYLHKYDGPQYRAEMYAGRVACCPVLSHVEYAPRSIKVR